MINVITYLMALALQVTGLSVTQEKTDTSMYYEETCIETSEVVSVFPEIENTSDAYCAQKDKTKQKEDEYLN